MTTEFPPLAVVIPAAGIGKRMQADVTKQYLKLDDQTILEHTIRAFTALPFVELVVVAIAPHDTVFSTLAIAKHKKLVTVEGGQERAHSVLSGLKYLIEQDMKWVMVHDAARPCVLSRDIQALYTRCIDNNASGILATKVRDTMKRAVTGTDKIATTVEREDLWHALTPQCSKIATLYRALSQAFDQTGAVSPEITDEASALERAGETVYLVEGSVRNIKVTHPEDLPLAKIFISSEIR